LANLCVVWLVLWCLTPLSTIFSYIELTTLVVVGTDCTGSCKSNYHTFMSTTAPNTTLVVICTDGTGSCKSNYHTIMSTTTPNTTLVVIGTDGTGSCKSN